MYKKWNNDLRSFDYLLGMDPCNSHYYNWWKVNLEDRDVFPEFEKLVNYSTNMELWGDIIEAATGIFHIAERVPELQKFLDCEFLPEDVASWMILHSISDSIRNFVGWRPGSKSKRKKTGSYVPGQNLKWNATFDPLYITPPWEFQTNREPSPQAQPVTRRPDMSLGIEPLNTLLCVASLGSCFINCTCKSCILVRRILCRANPTLRSVMARTGEEQVEFTEEHYDNLRHLVEQSYHPAALEHAPQADAPGPEASGSGGVGHGPRHQQPGSPRELQRPKLACGVTLQTFISNLRGVFGERTRDTTTKYEARYVGMGPERALEQLLSIPTNPQMLIQGDSSNFFDCHQPSNAGVDLKYMEEECLAR